MSLAELAQSRRLTQPSAINTFRGFNRRNRVRALLAGLMSIGGVVLWTACADASGQHEDQIDMQAVGVQAFRTTEKVCEYEPEVGIAVDGVDRYFTRNLGAAWDNAKERAEDNARSFDNFTTLLANGSKPSQCVTLGLTVGNLLYASLLLVAPDPVVIREAGRLTEGHGRAKVGAVGNSPMPPRYDGGTAPADQPSSFSPTAIPDLSGPDKYLGCLMSYVVPLKVRHVGAASAMDHARLQCDYLAHGLTAREVTKSESSAVIILNALPSVTSD